MERLIRAALLAIMVGGGMVWADAPEVSFKQGNAAFTDGKFADAVTLYEAARAGGLKSWVLEYNLGDAYYRTDHLGKAVAHFARAFRLNSTDHDVIDNLNLTLTKAGDPLLPNSGLAVFLWRLFYGIPLNLLTFGASLVFFILFGLAVWRLWNGRAFPVEAWALLGVLEIALAGWTYARWSLQTQPQAVVITTVAEVRSGPNPSYPANFTIPEGRRVLVLAEQEPVQGWLEIGVPQEGLKGWVPDASVDVL